jgi:hypothetical protein
LLKKVKVLDAEWNACGYVIDLAIRGGEKTKVVSVDSNTAKWLDHSKPV